MNLLDETMLPMLLASKLSDLGVTDDLQKEDAMSAALSQCTDIINNAITQLRQDTADTRQEITDAKKKLDKTEKAANALESIISNCEDKLGPTPVPQQDMNAAEEPAPAPQEQPASEMTPPPEMNVPPAPDMGAVPDMNAQPAPDAGMMPPPDMTQISPDMLGAIQPRY